jgi:hypothetical protein
MNQADKSAPNNGTKRNLWINPQLWTAQLQRAKQLAFCQSGKLYSRD